MAYPMLSVLPGDHDIFSVTFGQNIAFLRKASAPRVLLSVWPASYFVCASVRLACFA
jgi:hypothetical protein